MKDGYTQIDNNVLNGIITRKFTEYELKVILLICRLTFGCRRRENVWLRNKYFKVCGVGITNIGNIIEKLQNKKVLIVSDKKYQLNINTDEWDVPIIENDDITIKKLIHRQLKKVIKLIISGNKKDNNKVSESITSSYKKDNNKVSESITPNNIKENNKENSNKNNKENNKKRDNIYNSPSFQTNNLKTLEKKLAKSNKPLKNFNEEERKIAAEYLGAFFYASMRILYSKQCTYINKEKELKSLEESISKHLDFTISDFQMCMVYGLTREKSEPISNLYMFPYIINEAIQKRKQYSNDEFINLMAGKHERALFGL